MEPKFYYRRFSAFLICLLLTSGIYAQQVARSLTASTGLFIGFYEYKPVNYNADPSKKYPLIVFLHGIGERGDGASQLPMILANGIPKYINAGHDMTFTSLTGQEETFLVLSPQLSASYGSWQNIYVEEMLKYAKANLRIDTNRIYLTGLSLGGGGTWNYATASLANARQFAAIAPVCGTNNWSNLCNLATANVPVWAFHAQDDGIVSVSNTNNAINQLNACNPAVRPIKTIYPNGNHWIWDRSYDTVNSFHNPNVFEWFLGHARNLPANTKPVANAGADRIITLPLSTVTLNGGASVDTDGSIARASWRMIQSPGGGWLQSPNAINCNANNLSQGVYRFELTVVDNRAGWSMDTVTVTVNPTSANLPPVPQRNNDTVVANPTIPLNASASYDLDGYISAYAWRQVGGPGAINVSCTNCPNPVVSNMINNGTYAVELEVIDNLGATTKDTVFITESYAVAPVDFLYFKGKNIGKNNILQWATATEFNNQGFEVQRSSDGKEYTSIGFVQGAGAAEQRREYSFTDVSAPQKLSYYRLRQLDAGMQAKFSPVITVDNANSRLSLEYYPNPVKNSLLVQLQTAERGLVKVRLRGLDGKLLREEQVFKNQELLSTKLDVQTLNTGVYFMEIEMNTIRETRMIIKN
jgi:predicted esterase